MNNAYFVTNLKGSTMADLSLSRPQTHSGTQAAPKVRLSVFPRLLAVWRQRRHLDRLDAHMRRDLGLTDAQVHREVDRAVWDAPAIWRH